MQLLIILSLLFIAASSTFSQDEEINFPEKGFEYSNAKILTNDFEKFSAEEIWLKEDKVIFLKDDYSKLDSISLSEVKMIRATTGSYIVEGMISLFIISSAEYVRMSMIPRVKIDFNDVAKVVGSLTLVGGIIGYLIPKSSTIYQSGTLKISLFNFNDQNRFIRNHFNNNLINFTYNF